VTFRWHKTVKKRGPKVVAVPPGVLDLIAPGVPDELVFQAVRGAYRGKPLRTRVPLGVFHKALKACWIPKGEVDQHSFRLTWITMADREGVTPGVGTRQVGHTNQAMWAHYQQNSAAPEVHDAVRKVYRRVYRKSERSSRETAPSSTRTPHESPSPASC